MIGLRLTFLATLLLILAPLTASSAHAGTGESASVTVAPETVAQGERLTLGDIAEIRSADATTTERLRAVALGYAPNVGAVREMAKEKIAVAIAAAGFSTDTVKLEAPAVAIIKRAGQTVSPKLLREAVERVALAGLQGAGATAEIVRLDLPQSVQIPSGTVEARAFMGNVKDLAAPFPVAIELLVGGRVVRRLTATVQVEAQAPVLVAAHDLADHARLRESDVRIEMRKLERSASLYVRDTERLRGAALSRPLASGEPIMTEALYSDIVIKPGDAVNIVGESGSFNVKVTGEARAAGRVGERIQVKNLQSGVLLQAVVVDEGSVRVRF